MTPDEIAARLTTSIDKATVGAGSLDTAAQSADEALQSLNQATQGTRASEVDQAGNMLTAVIAQVGSVKSTIDAAMTYISAYRTRLVGSQPAPSAGPLTQPASPPPPRSAEPAEVQAARASLPPPVVKGTRTRTHGSWFSAGEPPSSITSGTADGLYANTQAYLEEHGMGRTVIGSHVETKLAVHMRQEDLRDVTVALNHRPCEGRFGCDTLLPQVLPEGATLTVYGVEQDGTPTKHTYIGRRDDR